MRNRVEAMSKVQVGKCGRRETEAGQCAAYGTRTREGQVRQTACG